MKKKRRNCDVCISAATMNHKRWGKMYRSITMLMKQHSKGLQKKLVERKFVWTAFNIRVDPVVLKIKEHVEIFSQSFLTFDL